MVRESSSDLHRQVLNWAHEQVRESVEERASVEGAHSRWPEVRSKLGFCAAAAIGLVTAGWASVVGATRTAESRLSGRGGDAAEDAWERANEALQTVFDSLTGLVDSETILTRQELKNIAQVSSYGQRLTELNNITPEVRKALAEQLKRAQFYVIKGGEGANEEVTSLGKVFDAVKETPTVTADKLKNVKWTRQS